MRKIAVFVEGQTELIVVRELLLKWTQYEISIECRSLFTNNLFRSVDYDFPNPSADIHVQVINVGMDGNVITRMLNREQHMTNSGYELIIGLRDMYSIEYKKQVKNNSVDEDLNKRFWQGAENTIIKIAKQPDLLRVCFAIMEIEAWWIGIPSLWDGLEHTTTTQYSDAFLNPEMVFHPASVVNDLLQILGKTYSKHKGEVEAIVSQITREDYLALYESQRCRSFCYFLEQFHLKV